ncbi:MAG: hypothetical protein IAF08_10620 [Rhizobacter sp.]|nr:hypothetical protein [Chlorobiales bacterium]
MQKTQTETSRKKTAMRLIRQMKDSAAYEEMMYELYVLQKIELGRDDMREGHVYTHTEAKRKLGKWLK